MTTMRAGSSRRELLCTGVALSVPAALLAACGQGAAPQAGGPGGSKKPVTISYWGKWGGSSEEAENEVIANFQGKFPHVTVDGLEDKQVAGEGSLDREKFTAALAAGTPPEVIKIDRFKMAGHGAKNATAVLDDLVKRDKIDMKKFYDATVQEVLYPPGPGGKVTALPWNTDDRALIYNKKHFMEVGLDPNKPPKTWEEAQDYGTKLTKLEGGKLVRAGFVAWGANTNWSIGWHWSAGGQWLKPGPDGKPNRKAAFNDDKARRWMQYIQENMNRVLGGFPAYQDWSKSFGPREQGAWYSDGISMGVDGVWKIGDFRKYGPDVDYGVAPAPRPKGLEATPVTWAGGFALAIPTGIKGDSLDAAWEFLKYYCYGKDAQLLFGSRTGQMPALMEAADAKEFKEADPHMPVFVDVMKSAKIRDVTPAGDEIWFTTKDRQFAIFGLADRLYEAEMSPTDILSKAEQHVNQTLDEAWSRAGS